MNKLAFLEIDKTEIAEPSSNEIKTFYMKQHKARQKLIRFLDVVRRQSKAPIFFFNRESIKSVLCQAHIKPLI